MPNFGIWATFRNKIAIFFNSPSITHKDEHFKKTMKIIISANFLIPFLALLCQKQ